MAKLVRKKHYCKEGGGFPGAQDYIRELEALFFNIPANGLEYNRLVPRYKNYDAEYDRKAREGKKLNLVYILDELLARGRIGASIAQKLLNEIEETIFSPDFYRHLLLGSYALSRISKKLYRTAFHLRQEVALLRNESSENKYANTITDFGFLSPPSTLQEYLSQVADLAETLENKADRLLQILEQ